MPGAVGIDLQEMVVHFWPDDNSPQKEREGGVSVYCLKKGKQNVKSPSRNCRKENVDGPSVLRNRKCFENPTDPVAAVHYKEEELNELQMDHPKDFETVDSEGLRNDWREKVSVGQFYDRFRQEVIKML